MSLITVPHLILKNTDCEDVLNGFKSKQTNKKKINQKKQQTNHLKSTNIIPLQVEVLYSA